MDRLEIIGGSPLQGEVKVEGAKNAALPILFSSILTSKGCRFDQVPNLLDIDATIKLLTHLGVQVSFDKQTGQVDLCAEDINTLEAPYDLVRKMRASVLALGPLVARFGKAKVSLPGGCAIGARPIQFHLEGLKKLGAQIELEEGYVLAKSKKLIGDRIKLDFPSVGATENLMMAASLAQGETLIENAAREPEIVDLANTLIKMGSEIKGQGTENISIQGKQELLGCHHQVMGDRIEAATYLTAAFMTQGKVKVTGVSESDLKEVLHKFTQAGATINCDQNSIELITNSRPQSCDITTEPFPGFPTDMQAQFMALMSLAEGVSWITENIFENRFMHVPELNRLGAQIEVQGHRAKVTGVKKLKAAPLMATDLRASACLVLGGLSAEGKTTVSRVYHLDRGYDQIEVKLQNLGAQIQRVKSS